jgi:hypothetical protein
VVALVSVLVDVIGLGSGGIQAAQLLGLQVGVFLSAWCIPKPVPWSDGSLSWRLPRALPPASNPTAGKTITVRPRAPFS